MNDPKLIKQHIRDFVKAKSDIGYQHEYIFYRFSTEFVERNKTIIIEKIITILNKLIIIMRQYLENKNVKDYDVQNLYIANKLTEAGSKNTGNIAESWNDINDILHNKNTNIREVFAVLDEFIHKCCKIMSWNLYLNKNIDLSKYHQANMFIKLKKIFEIFYGKIYVPNNIKVIRNKIIIALNNKWQSEKLPSVCQIWNEKDLHIRTHRLIHLIEFQRDAKFKNSLNPLCFEWLDDRFYKEPEICNDKNMMGENVSKLLIVNNIKLPKLSEREIKWAKKINSNIMFDGYIPWKGGCCTTPAHNHTVTARITELYDNATRVTSYSGHAILEFDLLSIMDSEFDEWKYIYAMCCIATMLPYCHHSSHEILVCLTYFGIPYDFTRNTNEIISDIINKINNDKIDKSLDLLKEINNEWIKN